MSMQNWSLNKFPYKGESLLFQECGQALCMQYFPIENLFSIAIYMYKLNRIKLYSLRVKLLIACIDQWVWS